LNALDLETLIALRDRLAELAKDVDVHVVVLTGAGDRAFIAGADIKYMSGLDADEAKAWGDLGHEAGRLLENMRQPTIAAINGFALGGGCELALACDLRYASSNAKLGQPEINLGIIPGWGGTQRLARTATLGFADGALGHFDCGFDVPMRRELEVVGSEGVLFLEPAFGSDDGVLRIRRGDEVEQIDVPKTHRYQLEVENFSRATRGEEAQLLDRAESVAQARTIAALLHSAETDRPARLVRTQES